MAVGDAAWVLHSLFFEDDRGMLWLEGNACRRGWDEGGCARIERTPDGVRVLVWPAGQTVHWERRQPNRYPVKDIWVVDLPAEEG